MKLRLFPSTLHAAPHVGLSGSKSESNRLLLLQAFYPELEIKNLSTADDCVFMQKALRSEGALKDVHHAGTAMRFLTAYYALQEQKEIVLTGSARMQQRPIGVLVTALQELGCHITYQDQEGFPPLRIKGTIPAHREVEINAQISSQYISALLLIGAQLPHGLTVHLLGECTSRPYLEMTQSLLHQVGIPCRWEGQRIDVAPTQKLTTTTVTVESDWSSASYYYSIIALSPVGTRLTLSSLRQKSLQADAVLSQLYIHFGVETVYENEQVISLTKTSTPISSAVSFNLIHAPDIAQTIAVTAFGLGVELFLEGLHTLKIKETDRLMAMQNELAKFGAQVEVGEDWLRLKREKLQPTAAIPCVATYEDHRMAMAFAPLAVSYTFDIENAEVVSKSYPAFWTDLRHIGFKIASLE